MRWLRDPLLYGRNRCYACRVRAEITERHMIVLALLRDETINTVEEAGAALGVAAADIRPLISDLEAAGYIEPASVH